MKRDEEETTETQQPGFPWPPQENATVTNWLVTMNHST